MCCAVGCSLLLLCSVVYVFPLHYLVLGPLCLVGFIFGLLRCVVLHFVALSLIGSHCFALSRRVGVSFVCAHVHPLLR